MVVVAAGEEAAGEEAVEAEVMAVQAGAVGDEAVVDDGQVITGAGYHGNGATLITTTGVILTTGLHGHMGTMAPVDRTTIINYWG